MTTIIYQEPDSITHSFVINPVTCTGWSNGSITWNGYGGVGSATTYTYLWNTGNTWHTINSLDTGLYNITVTDENTGLPLENVVGALMYNDELIVIDEISII